MNEADNYHVAPDDPIKVDPMRVVCGIVLVIMMVVGLFCEVFDVSLWPLESQM